MDRSDDLKIKIPAYVFCVLLSVFVLLPILAFCIMSFASKFPVDMSFTFKHIADTFSKGGGEFLFNSLLYAVMVAVIGTISAFFCAYAASRLKCKLSKPLHLVSILSMAIPGIVLGLSYVIFFHNTAIYGTVIIVVLVNSVHFFSSPYLMIYNTLVKVNGNIEDVGRSLGISRIRIIFSVIIPKVFLTLLEMFVYFFVNAMMTISAISFLMPPSPKSLALMINQFEAQSLVESAAFVSLLILAVNLILKVVLTVVKHKNSEQKD